MGWGCGARSAEISPLFSLPLQIAATWPVGVGCGERMGLLPFGAHNGQRRFREVPALPSLRPQSAFLGKSSSSSAPTGGDGWTRFPTATT